MIRDEVRRAQERGGRFGEHRHPELREEPAEALRRQPEGIPAERRDLTGERGQDRADEGGVERHRLALEARLRSPPGVRIRGVRDQRHVELDVELDGAGRAAPGESLAHAQPHCGGRDVRGERRGIRAGGEVEALAHVAEYERLVVDRLVGAGRAEAGRPVGGEGEQREAAVGRLEHGGVEVGDGAAGGRHHGDRPVGPGGPPALGDAEGEEAGLALIDAHPDVEEPGGGRLGDGVGERGGPRTRGDDDVAHPGGEQG